MCCQPRGSGGCGGGPPRPPPVALPDSPVGSTKFMGSLLTYVYRLMLPPVIQPGPVNLCGTFPSVPNGPSLWWAGLLGPLSLALQSTAAWPHIPVVVGRGGKIPRESPIKQFFCESLIESLNDFARWQVYLVSPERTVTIADRMMHSFGCDQCVLAVKPNGIKIGIFMMEFALNTQLVAVGDEVLRNLASGIGDG